MRRHLSLNTTDIVGDWPRLFHDLGFTLARQRQLFTRGIVRTEGI